MSEHGWPDFHDYHGGHGDGHDDSAPHHDDDALVVPHEDIDVAAHHDDDSAWHDEPAEVHDAEVHDDVAYEHHVETPAAEPEDQPWTAPEHDMGLVGADPDALPDADTHAVDVFPQVVDVGPLPEPVDGFPWIDTGSLGLVDAHPHLPPAEVTPQELAEYAGADLPPGADPWAALTGSEDPATSALARWWSEQQQ